MGYVGYSRFWSIWCAVSIDCNLWTLNPEPGTDQLRYKVSFSIKLAVFLASGRAHMKLRLTGTVKRLNVEHRTSNIERPILMTLRFIYFKPSELQNTESQPATSSPRRARACLRNELRPNVACRRQPSRNSKGRFAWLSLYLNWQNTLFDVGRSMFNVRCSFFS